MPRKVQVKNGGWFWAREKGEAPSPNSGRPRNIFKEAIRDVAEHSGKQVEVVGLLVDTDGNVTDQEVRVMIALPSVQAVVQTMFRRAAKGNVQAAKWLTETGYGKSIQLGEDPENPLGGGFAVVLPDNGRDR